MGKTNPAIERWSKDMSRQLRKEEIQTANHQRSAMGVFAAVKCARLTCVYGLARYLRYSVERKETGGSLKTAARAGFHYVSLSTSFLKTRASSSSREESLKNWTHSHGSITTPADLWPYHGVRRGGRRWSTRRPLWPLSHPAPPWDPKILVVVVVVCLFCLS